MKDDTNKWLKAEPQIEQLISKGEHKRALKVALEGLNATPQELSFLRVCAYCYTELRQFTEANNSIQKLPLNDFASDFLKANWYMRQNKFTEAEKILANASSQKNDLDSLIQLARLYEIMYSTNRYRIFKLPGTQKKIENKFLSVADKVELIFDKSIISEKLKAAFYLKNKNNRKALECLNQINSIDPNDSWTYIRLAWVYLSSKKNKTAKKFLDQGLAISPNDALGNYLQSRIKKYGEKDRINTDSIQFKALAILALLLLVYLCGNSKFHGIPFLYLFKIGLALLIVLFGGSWRSNKQDLKDIVAQVAEREVPNF